MKEYTFFWFRRDLRLDDNAGLFHALQANHLVIPLFIFDEDIIDELPKNDPRITFIYQSLQKLSTQLDSKKNLICIKKGKTADVWQELIKTFKIKKVVTNHDYEPYAIKRDNRIKEILKGHNIEFETFKDQVIFEKDEVLKDDGKPYTVFTPYSRKWKKKLQSNPYKHYNSEKHLHKINRSLSFEFPSIEQIGFQLNEKIHVDFKIQSDIIDTYDRTRDIPSIIGTTRLGIHLRFGTLSVRKLADQAINSNEIYLNELIWREFYMMILSHFPHIVSQAYSKKWQNIKWRHDKELFSRWKEGKTGFPIVDAGMRELNETGYMHNRVRMITASFLTKLLLIDYRWGEAYFAEKLLDFELASNNGGWQWAAGSGCDAAPYFRIFNPDSQTKKFDPELKYIKKWVPEFQEFNYPSPIIDYKSARVFSLEYFKKQLN